MLKAVAADVVVAPPGVGADLAATPDVLEHEVREDIGGGVGNPAHTGAARAAVVAVDSDHDQRLPDRASTAPARLHPAHKGFVDLDGAGQHLAARQHHRSAKLVQ